MWRFVPLLLIICQLDSAVYAQAPKVRKIDGCFLIYEKCKPIIKQAEWGIDVQGLPVGHNGTIGPIKLNQTLTQKLTDIAQLLDLEQLGRCQDLNRVTTCDKTREPLLRAAAMARSQIIQLAILAQLHSHNADELAKALQTWIVRSADLMEKIYSNEPLAAGGKGKERIEKIRDAKKYALDELKISPDSPRYRELLADPIRPAL